MYAKMQPKCIPNSLLHLHIECIVRFTKAKMLYVFALVFWDLSLLRECRISSVMQIYTCLVSCNSGKQKRQTKRRVMTD